MKIAVVVSSPMTIQAFLHDQILHLSRSHNVTVVTNIDDPSELMLSEENVTLKPLKIVRKISLWNDIKVFYVLLKLFADSKFDLVYSVTPKAGLLAMLAGYVVRIRCRIHIFTGQVWVTRAGMGRLFFKTLDTLLAKLATQVLADSDSQRQFLIDENVVQPDKITVLANGSISGVNLKRFKSDESDRRKKREELGIGDAEVVFLFLGRFDPDKGIFDLVDAFRLIADQYASVKLIIVGPDEAGMRGQILSKIGSAIESLRIVDFTMHPEHYMNAADIFCLPSYREGFGSVVIEAAAVGIPAIGSDIYGIKDAIEDGVTGILFPVRDIRALYLAMEKMIVDPAGRLKFAQAAHDRAERLFSQDDITSAFIDYCNEAVGSYLVK